MLSTHSRRDLKSKMSQRFLRKCYKPLRRDRIICRRDPIEHQAKYGMKPSKRSKKWVIRNRN